MAVLESPPAPPAPPAARRSRSRPWPWLALLAALAVALAGLAGAALTLRPPPPPPAPRPTVRYDSGAPLADRLTVVFLPQFDEVGLARFGRALRPAASEPATVARLERPEYTSFAEVTVLLLAGSTTGPAGAPATTSGRPPDTLVRIVEERRGGALLFGPPEWRALFGLAPPAPAGEAAAPKTATLLAEAGAALEVSPADLLLLYLPDAAPRDLAPEAPGPLGQELAALGAALGEGDAVLLVGAGGGLGAPLAAAFAGAGVRAAPAVELDLNAIAPTCTVLLGAPYPAEARGRVAWTLLAADEERKARAAAALARQRVTLAAAAVPFGVAYPPPLTTAGGRVAPLEAALQEGQFAYSYQLASSAIDEADRALVTPAAATPLPRPGRAAWGLVALCLAAALLAPLLALAGRARSALLAGSLGATLALVCWMALVTALRRAIVPTVPVVAAVLLPPVFAGSLLSVRLGRGRRRSSPARRGLTVAIPALLAALPAALCAYRYGLPWQLGWEETAPLFRWRSALLAPAALLLAGGCWLGPLPALARRVRRVAGG